LTDVSQAAADEKLHRERAEVSVALADLAVAREEIAVARSHLTDAVAIFRHHGFTRQTIDAEARLDELG